MRLHCAASSGWWKTGYLLAVEQQNLRRKRQQPCFLDKDWPVDSGQVLDEMVAVLVTLRFSRDGVGGRV